MTNRFKVQKLFWGLLIDTNTFCFLSFAVWGQFQTFPDGWLGGWINRKYSHLSPQLGLGLRAELGNNSTTSSRSRISQNKYKDKFKLYEIINVNRVWSGVFELLSLSSLSLSRGVRWVLGQISSSLIYFLFLGFEKWKCVSIYEVGHHRCDLAKYYWNVHFRHISK